MAPVILENVSRVYPGGVLAVDRVSLEVMDRELLVLVGPSGCGKSTTLRMIAGLEDLSSGKIAIGSRVVNGVSPKDRDVAMVFQNYALYPHLSVYGNLAFGLELREGALGLGRLRRWLRQRCLTWRSALRAGPGAEPAAARPSIAERVRDAARILGVEGLLERFPSQLSGGERQRVALGRAIVRDPAVFLFDEPLSNLDAKLRVEMRRELKQLHERLQTTMIYVTHDQTEALTLGDRVVVMNEGKIQQIASPLEIYDWPKNRFVAGFIGAPAMNFVSGELVNHDGGPGFRRGDWRLPLRDRSLQDRDLMVPGTSNRPAILGVRPEDVRLRSAEPTSVDSLPAVVRFVESLGDATIVTLEVEEAAGLDRHSQNVTKDQKATNDNDEGLYLVAKTEPRCDVYPGDRVGVAVNARRAHLFDPQTGENWVRPATRDGDNNLR